MAQFSQELFDRICDQLSEGKSLRDICKADDMPNKGTVFRWLAEDEQLSDQYTRAREVQADAIFDECLALADAEIPDTVNPIWALQRAKLRIDTRKWMAGKLRPKKYGDKLDVTTGGEKLKMPTTVVLKAASDNSND